MARRLAFGVVLLLAGPAAAQPRPIEKPPETGTAERHRLEAEVAIAEARLLGKKAELDKAKVLVELAKVNFARLEDLVKRGVVTVGEIEEARAKIKIAEADVRIAEAGVMEAEAVLRLAKLRLAEPLPPPPEPKKLEPLPPPKQ